MTDELIANFGLTNIAAGTRVNSHFVFFDPLARETLQGTITFDTPVLAAITLRSQLIASNYLGAAGVTYLDPASVGLEPSVDFITLGSPGANSLRLNFLSTDAPGDHFRVITLASSPVPEPQTWAMMLAGVGMIGAAMRRRAKVSVRYQPV
ncbi:PEPxxWA-CTERM sorting domain-containing protein [Novosphingobium sp. G106]|nr:PEPxxWA-CTERM sorting domain-containing protein [Novosphingobium sp. G106]